MTSVAALLSLAGPVLAGPVGGTVVDGAAAISQAGNATNIRQSTNKAIINWQGFSVGAGESVNFHQPATSSVTLNRVIGNEASVINGAINANGQVFIVNSAGVLFGKGSQVNVGGLVASTHDISNKDFMAGNYTFSGTSNAAVINQGRIRAHGGGYVALLGKTVSNEGVISARLGTVAMSAGEKLTLNFEGNSLLDVTIDKGTLNALVANKRAIKADGGRVILTAKAADQLLSAQVNNTGIVQARTVAALKGGGTARKGGIKIYAYGGTTNIAGKLDASAPKGGDGGFIETSGEKVSIADSAVITTQGVTGKSGTWLIDPDGFTIGVGGDMTGDFLASQLTNTSVTISSTNGSGGGGNIVVNDAVSWSANKLTLNATNNIYVNAVMAVTGKGSFAANYGHVLDGSGNPKATVSGTGFNADGTPYGLYTSFGVVGINGTFSGRIDFSGSGEVWLNNQKYAVINDIAGLNAINSNLAGYYVLGNDIPRPGADWMGPIGASESNAFTGVLNGFGHRAMTFSGLSQGVFGYIGASATVSNLGVYQTAFSSVVDNSNVGILAGNNAGLIVNSFATGDSGVQSGTGTVIGGLVGWNTGTIVNSYAAARVFARYIGGGFVGINEGTIGNSYQIGPSGNSGITLSNAATVSWAGGFVGVNSGSITNAYVTSNNFSGPVNLTGAALTSGNAIAGGFVGSNTGSIAYAYVGGNQIRSRSAAGFAGNNAGSIDNAYVSAPVTIHAEGQGAGFVLTNTGSITNSYWDMARTGQAGDGADSTATGLSSLAGLPALPADFDPTYWGLSADGHPILKTLPVYVSVRAPLEYGSVGSAVASNVTLTGLQWGDTASNAFTYAPSSGLLSPSGHLNAGGYGVDQVLASAYETFIGKNVVITPKSLALALTGIVADKTYDGTTAAALDVVAANSGLVGLLSGDTLTVTYRDAIFKNASAGSKVVSLTATLGDGADGTLASNYTLAAPAGTSLTTTATITPATLTASYTANDKIYDGTTTAAVSVTGLSGLLAGDSVSISASGMFADANAGADKIVTVMGSLSGESAANYILTAAPTSAASITPRPLELLATQPAGGSLYIPASNITVTNLVAGDSVSLSGSGFILGSSAGTYAMSLAALNASGNANYTMNGATGLAVIYQAPLPVGGTVVSGTAAISTGGTTMTIQQSSDRAIIDWRSFDVGVGYTVAFNQPTTQSVTLNRVIGNEQSVIAGTITAPGQVFIVNSAGILFTGTSQVNVGALVASTQTIAANDFLAGNYTFGTNAATGWIEAHGAITLGHEGGYVALLGNGVASSASIKAPGGKVVMAGGSDITLAVDSAGRLGDVSVATADKWVDVGGMLDVSSPVGDGGTVETAGFVSVDAGIRAMASGAAGFADGFWRMRTADDFNIGSTRVISGTSLSRILGLMDATIMSDSGDIHVNDRVSWSANTLTLASNKDVNVNNVMTVTGSGSFTASYGQSTAIVPVASGNEHHTALFDMPEVNIYGVVMARGKNADGSDTDTFAGRIDFDSTGSVRMGITGGALKTYQVVNSVAALASLDANTNYILGSDIDLGGYADWTPVAGAYTGTFNGFGHLVRNLKSTQGGLFGAIAGSYRAPSGNPTEVPEIYVYPDGAGVHNLGVVDVAIDVANATNDVGALAARSANALLRNVFTTGALRAAATDTGMSNPNAKYHYAGGLVGEGSGLIIGSYSRVDVAAVNMNRVGSLVGWLPGYAADSYATGDVTSTLTMSLRYGSDVGGFAGNNYGRIVNSYASGNVIGSGSVGGFVGDNGSIGDIFGSAASGNVTIVDTSPYSLSNYGGGFAGTSWGVIMLSSASGHVASTSGGPSGNADAGGPANLGGFTGTTRYSALSILNYFNADTSGLRSDGPVNVDLSTVGQDGNTPVLDAFNAKYGTNLTPAQFHGGAVGMSGGDYAAVQQQSGNASAVARSVESVMNGGAPINAGSGTGAGSGGGGVGLSGFSRSVRMPAAGPSPDQFLATMQTTSVSATLGVDAAAAIAVKQSPAETRRNAASEAVDDALKQVERNVEVEDKKRDRDRQRRVSARRGTGGGSGAGYGATIRSIDVDGQRFDLENGGNTSAPAAGGGTQ